jgi:Aldo/keto reductase family
VESETQGMSGSRQGVPVSAADRSAALGLTRAEFLGASVGSILLSTGTPAAGQTGREAAFSAGAMLTRPIPSTGETMPVIGLGTWQAFDVGADPAAKRALREVLELLLESGGRMIDSSPMYGRAEAVVGDLLAEMAARPRAFLATKVWTIGRERGIEQMQRSARLLRDANT